MGTAYMEKYKYASGSSGVELYEIGESVIKIKFHDRNCIYVYTGHKPGEEHVARMKQLAIEGKGLATYINKYIRDNYDHLE